MRILITACWGHGHVNPVLPLALAAQRAGHEIVLATGANLLDHVRSHGVPAWPVGNSCAEDEASFRAAYPEAASRPSNERLRLVLRELFATAADRRVPDLLDRTRHWRPDLVIHEVTELAGAVVAARMGSRHVVHGLGMPMTRVTWDATLGPGFAELVQKWDVPELTEGLFNATYLDIFPPGLSSGPPAWPDTRPLRSAGLAAPPFDTWDAARLATLPHPQTVHLTLGTVFHGASGVLEAALTGLRELPLNVVLTVGPEGIRSGSLRCRRRCSWSAMYRSTYSCPAATCSSTTPAPERCWPAWPTGCRSCCCPRVPINSRTQPPAPEPGPDSSSNHTSSRPPP